MKNGRVTPSGIAATDRHPTTIASFESLENRRSHPHLIGSVARRHRRRFPALRLVARPSGRGALGADNFSVSTKAGTNGFGARRHRSRARLTWSILQVYEMPPVC